MDQNTVLKNEKALNAKIENVVVDNYHSYFYNIREKKLTKRAFVVINDSYLLTINRTAVTFKLTLQDLRINENGFILMHSSKGYDLSYSVKYLNNVTLAINLDLINHFKALSQAQALLSKYKVK